MRFSAQFLFFIFWAVSARQIVKRQSVQEQEELGKALYTIQKQNGTSPQQLMGWLQQAKAAGLSNSQIAANGQKHGIVLTEQDVNELIGNGTVATTTVAAPTTISLSSYQAVDQKLDQIAKQKNIPKAQLVDHLKNALRSGLSPQAVSDNAKKNSIDLSPSDVAEIQKNYYTDLDNQLKDYAAKNNITEGQLVGAIYQLYNNGKGDSPETISDKLKQNGVNLTPNEVRTVLGLPPSTASTTIATTTEVTTQTTTTATTITLPTTTPQAASEQTPTTNAVQTQPRSHATRTYDGDRPNHNNFYASQGVTPRAG